MAAEKTETKELKKRGHALRWLGILVLGLLVLLVVGYFVVTSSAFLKGVILPRAGKAFGAEITVADASIQPFSQVVLRDLKVQPKGQETLLTAAEARARYNLMAILRGNINVEEVALSSPVVRVVMNADGTSNLDPFLEGEPGPAPHEPASKPASPPQVDVKKVTIDNATLGFTRTDQDGSKIAAELTGLNLRAEGIRNGQPAKLSLGANARFAQASGTNLAEIAATLKGAFGIDLGADLMPKRIQGDSDLAVTQATGAFADAAQLNTVLTADLDLTEIRQLAFRFAKGGTALGAVTAAGPFDALKQEGKLKVKVTGIGNELLSLVGGRFGIYFGSTKLAADYDVELKNQAQFVNTTGTIVCDQFSVTRSNLTTPVIDFRLDYNATVDLPRTNATVRAFNLNATQAGRPLLKAGLTKELVLDWSKGAEGVAESTFELALTELNLADWKPFIGEYADGGVVNGRLDVKVQKAGRLIAFDLASKLAGLSGRFGSNRLDKADLALGVRGRMTEFDAIDLAALTLDVSHVGQPVAALKGAGRLAASTQDTSLETELTAFLAPLSATLNRPDLSLSSGTVKFTGNVTQKNLTPARTNNPVLDRSLAGKMAVSALTGVWASNRFDRFEMTADLDVQVTNDLAQIRRCVGALRQAGQAGGSFEATGRYHLTNQVGEMAFKLTDLNQHTLRSFLAAALEPMTLDAISIGAAATARYAAFGDSGVKGEVQVANVLISDPTGRIPKVPLTAEFKLDAALSAKGLAEIRQCVGNVRQGNNPAGDFDLTGRYDLTNETGQVTMKLTGLNQNALQPFLAQSLGDMTLASVSIDTALKAGYDAKGDSSLAGDLQITNLVVKDPSGLIPATPLEAKLKLDAAMRTNVANIRELALTLTPTSRAANRLGAAGQLDFTRTNGVSGNLRITADALDATRYYDLFMGTTAAAPTGAPGGPAARSAPAADEELEAITLPLRNFVVDANIQRFYLREVEISNLVAKVTLDGGLVVLNPVQLALNGAPVNATADLDLSVPGYKYALGFQGANIPLAPMVNSFVPDYRGKVSGAVSANAQVKGAGTTDASLIKNLASQFDLAMTNLNLAVVDVRQPILKKVIDVVVGLPDLIRNPGAGVVGIVGRLTGTGGSGGGFTDQVTKPPIDRIALKGDVANRLLNLQQAAVHSVAFQASAAGSVALAPQVTNSMLNMPVQLALARPLAEKIGLAGNTPTNVPYAQLPSFVTMKGTVGVPKSDFNYPALLAAVAQAGSGILGQTGSKDVEGVAGALGALGNLVGGGAAKTNAPTAGQSGTGVDGLVQGIFGGGKSAATNTTSTNAPRSPVNPLDLFRRR